MMQLLDNIAWHALSGPHSKFSVGTDEARRYASGFSAIVGFANPLGPNLDALIGDEVLLLLARLMRSHFRFHDQLYRFGGEEFVVLMRCHGEPEAFNVLERLRILTQQHLFPQVGTITISIGFTEIKAGDSPSGAFERSDKAVYYSKEHGRNQVSSFAGLIFKGEVTELVSNVGDVELF